MSSRLILLSCCFSLGSSSTLFSCVAARVSPRPSQLLAHLAALPFGECLHNLDLGSFKVTGRNLSKWLVQIAERLWPFLPGWSGQRNMSKVPFPFHVEGQPEGHDPAHKAASFVDLLSSHTLPIPIVYVHIKPHVFLLRRYLPLT